MSSTEPPQTDVWHDENEVAVRSRSQHSRSAHIPLTDDDGNVIFKDNDGDRVPPDHEEAEPRPACGRERRDDTEWVLRPIRFVNNRDECDRCFREDEFKAKNKSNGKSKTFARIARYGSDWGGEEQSTKATTGK